MGKYSTEFNMNLSNKETLSKPLPRYVQQWNTKLWNIKTTNNRTNPKILRQNNKGKANKNEYFTQIKAGHIKKINTHQG